MQTFTQSGEQAIRELAQRYRVSYDAVCTLLYAVSNGGGSMAQFYHPELGGGGQWMRGGMTMVGDMFNSGLQSTVSGLCSELSSLLNSTQVFPPAPVQSQGNFGGSNTNNWWPSELGYPSSSGGQNDAKYAYFPQACRLAILRNGQVTLYNTLDHNIGGVQQQQGGAYGSLSFSSQFGTFTVESLPLADQGGYAPPPQAAPAPYYPPEPEQPQSFSPVNQNQNSGRGPQSHDEIISALEKLGGLHQMGVLTDAEFQSKKSELLSRL